MTGDRAIEVALRWRDLDHQGHVYHATVLTLLDEARTAWLRGALGVDSPDQYVVARIEIDYTDEIRRSDERIAVSFSVDRLGRTSLRTHEVVRAPDGRVLVEASVTSVMWDRDARRPRPLTEHERVQAAGFAEAPPVQAVPAEASDA